MFARNRLLKQRNCDGDVITKSPVQLSVVLWSGAGDLCEPDEDLYRIHKRVFSRIRKNYDRRSVAGCSRKNDQILRYLFIVRRRQGYQLIQPPLDATSGTHLCKHMYVWIIKIP